MHKVKATLTYYVSDTTTCDGCRFCHTQKGSATCLLTNEILNVYQNGPVKTRKCIANIPITHEEVPPVKPEIVIKEAIKGYSKLLGGYIKAGYPFEIADRLAKEAMK